MKDYINQTLRNTKITCLIFFDIHITLNSVKIEDILQALDDYNASEKIK